MHATTDVWGEWGYSKLLALGVNRHSRTSDNSEGKIGRTRCLPGPLGTEGFLVERLELLKNGMPLIKWKKTKD